jgi:elongator complex protein 1
MALCEINLDSNAIDIAFSKAGTKFAALTALGVSVYHWALSATPVPTPQLQSFYPFSDFSARPRRVSFLNETEVYTLKQHRFCPDEIERTCLDTRETMAVFRAKDSERVSSIFPDLAQNTLWFLQQGVNGKPSSYSTVFPESGNRTSVITWNESPVQDTSWAQATQLGNGGVGYHSCYKLSKPC